MYKIIDLITPENRPF